MRRSTTIGALFLALLALLALNLPAIAAPGGDDDRWALIVGVDRFQGRTRPNVGSVGDARDFRELLARHGWRDDRIRVLTDEAATAEGIRAGVRWLVDSSTPNSRSVFHYSGHVKQIEGDQDRDGEALDEYLWPHDNRFISDGELAQSLRELKGLAWIDISGCEAGGFNEGLATPRRLFTASSAEPEKSYEHPDWANSVWSGLLVDQGMLKGAADSNRDGDVTLREAVEWAAPRATSITKDEPKGPQHPFAAGGEETNWFARPAPPSSETPPTPPEERCLVNLPGGLCPRSKLAPAQRSR
ncbi:MAG: caspase family protein [Actinomycetota bacterium]